MQRLRTVSAMLRRRGLHAVGTEEEVCTLSRLPLATLPGICGVDVNDRVFLVRFCADRLSLALADPGGHIIVHLPFHCRCGVTGVSNLHSAA